MNIMTINPEQMFHDAVETHMKQDLVRIQQLTKLRAAAALLLKDGHPEEADAVMFALRTVNALPRGHVFPEWHIDPRRAHAEFSFGGEAK